MVSDDLKGFALGNFMHNQEVPSQNGSSTSRSASSSRSRSSRGALRNIENRPPPRASNAKAKLSLLTQVIEQAEAEAGIGEQDPFDRVSCLEDL